MNWKLVAEGSLPDNDAFERLSRQERVSVLRDGLSWLQKLEAEPLACQRVGKVVLHFMEAFGVEDDYARGACVCRMGFAAVQLGAHDEATSYLRSVLLIPLSNTTMPLHAEAMANLGSLLLENQPTQAVQFLRQAFALAGDLGDKAFQANTAGILGAALRKLKDYQGARQIYEKGIAHARSLGDSGELRSISVAAKLHGNLANLLSEDFGLHDAAIPHYFQAIDCYEKSNKLTEAGERYFSLINTSILAGNLDVSLALLEKGVLWATVVPDALIWFVESQRWSHLAPELIAKFERAFEAILVDANERLSESAKLHLAVVLALREARTQQPRNLIDLLHRGQLQILRDSPFRAILTKEVLDIADSTGRYGLVWLLPWTVERTETKKRGVFKAAYYKELATIWLSGYAGNLQAENSDDGSILEQLRSKPLPLGFAQVPVDPPAWTNLVVPNEREAFSFLRTSLCASYEQVSKEYDSCYRDLSKTSSSRDFATGVGILHRAIFLADLIGQPDLQIASRRYLSKLVPRQSGGLTRERFDKCLAVLREADELAIGLPREVIKVASSLGLLLKEAPFANEDARFSEALSRLRSACDIARKEHLTGELVELQCNLANALGANPLHKFEDLLEAEALLRESLNIVGQLSKDKADEYVDTLHNSLGVVLLQISDFDNATSWLNDACFHLRQSLSLRRSQGDPDRIALSIGLLVGVLTKLREQYPTPAISSEIALLIEDMEEYGSQVEDESKRVPFYINAMISLEVSAPKEALKLGMAGLESARAAEVSRYFLFACQQVGRLCLRQALVDEAKTIYEEGVAALRELRIQGGSTNYRASLSKSFHSLYAGLFEAQTRCTCSDLDRWWTIDCAAAQTLLENLSGSLSLPGMEQILDELSQHLPAGTLIVQFFLTRQLEVIAVTLRKNPLLEIEFSSLNLSFDRIRAEYPEGLPIYNPRQAGKFEHQLDLFGRLLLEPVLTREILDQTKRVVFVPAWPLVDFAWHSMPLGPDGKVLGDFVEIVEVPSVAILTRLLGQKQRSLKKAVFIACDPQGMLSAHIQEVQHAFANINVPQKLVLTDRSQPVLKASVLEELRSSDLVHFAGHSVNVPGRPDQSGLSLSDGLLSAEEIASALGQHGPSLLILSSCESAQWGSDIEGLSISTAFLQAGVRSIIGSLWPVPDHIAAATAAGLYSRLTDMSPIRALNESRKQLRSTLPPPHHSYWSSFKILGWSEP